MKMKLSVFKYSKIILIFFLYNYYSFCPEKIGKFNYKKKNIMVALCTMGKKENLYAREFMNYYMNLGVDHMFIYDHNSPFTEKIEDVLDKKYKKKITFYETQKLNISCQKEAFTNCYENNKNNFDWFIMVDMDEYLYIIKDSLKNYLNDEVFNKCDFIKIHWMNSRDNNLLYYEPKPLFKRFKKPYIKSKYIKSIIRGNIPNLKYWVHSPYISPFNNVTCTNEGKIINYTNINFEFIDNINIKRAYIIHFRFKSTEEFIAKYKRGYSNWHGNEINDVMKERLSTYFKENGINLKKVNYIERELKLNLSSYKEKIFSKELKANNINYLVLLFLISLCSCKLKFFLKKNV